MIKKIQRFGCILILVTLPTACRHTFDPALKVEARLFGESVQLASEISNAQFDLAENANRLALQSNLNLQFDLGGRPDVEYPRLFSADDRKLRTAIFDNLIEYSVRLNRVVTRTDAEPIGGNLRSSEAVSDADLGRLGNGGGVSETTRVDLGRGLENISAYLFDFHAEAKLTEHMSNLNAEVEKVVFLLFLDIGDVLNRSQSCENQSSSELAIPIEMMGFSTCRSGLRAVSDAAITQALKIMRLRLKLAAPKELREAKSRPVLLDKIYQLERLRAKVDERLVETRRSLLGIAALHRQIATRLSEAADKAPPVIYLKLPAQPPIDQGFVQSLKALKTHIQTANEKILSVLAGEAR